MIKGIQVQCNITYPDYVSYSLYPMTKKKTFKVFFWVVVIMLVAILAISIANIVIANQNGVEFDPMLLLPIYVFVFMFGIIFLISLVSSYSRYSKKKVDFNKELLYSFLNNKVTIARPNKPEETIDIYNDKILLLEERRNKVFINLVNDRYYMIDKKKFINGDIAELRSWAIKHVKNIKMMSK